MLHICLTLEHPISATALDGLWANPNGVKVGEARNEKVEVVCAECGGLSHHLTDTEAAVCLCTPCNMQGWCMDIHAVVLGMCLHPLLDHFVGGC